MGIKMVVNQNKNLSEQVTEFEEGKKIKFNGTNVQEEAGI